MSLPSARQANAFFTPLRRGTTTFVVERREADVRLVQLILKFASSLRWKVVVLDTNALHASNIMGLQDSSEERGGTIILRVPTTDRALEDWLVDSFLEDYQLLVIDDMNTLHNLLSVRARPANRILQFMGRSLSYLVKSGNKIAILIAYKNLRDHVGRHESALSIPRMSDFLVSTLLQDPFIRLRSEGKVWADNPFFIRA